jgi:hypothetical protein
MKSDITVTSHLNNEWEQGDVVIDGDDDVFIRVRSTSGVVGWVCLASPLGSSTVGIMSPDDETTFIQPVRKVEDPVIVGAAK